MHWDFTPEDVRSGKVAYSVSQFKQTLLVDIQAKFANRTEDKGIKQVYSFITIMFFTHLAFGKPIDSFVTSVKKYFPSEELQKFLAGNKEFLEGIKADNKENIEMLRAVIHRRIEDDVDKGVSKDNIVKTITTELLPF
jgi:hypothetical protein